MAEIIPVIAIKKPTIFKILCIDGGGIKGLYAATILRKFEEWNNC
jgi:patatin-like phospholipase/acyl hydrolase